MRINPTVSSAFLVFAVCFLVFSHTSVVTAPSDAVPNMFLPLNIIRGQGLYFDKLHPFFMIAANTGAEDGLPYYLSKYKDHYIADYPILSGLLAVPVYLVPVLINNVRIEDYKSLYAFMPSFGKLTASFYTAIGAAFLYLAFRKLVSRNKAFLLVFIYAFASLTLSVTSQAMWQHWASQLFWCLTIFFLTRDKLFYLSGLTMGLAVAARYPNLVSCIPVFAYIFIYRRDKFLRCFNYFAGVMLILAFYNWHFFGSPLIGGYERGSDKNFRNPIITGLSGLLLAPSKGIFIYSPVFIFSILGGILAWFNRREKLLKFISLSVVLFAILISAWSQWDGGFSFGPRLLADILPFLVFLLIPFFGSKFFNNRIVLGLFGVGVIWSLLVQLFGITFCLKQDWYREVVVTMPGTQALFSQNDWELAWYWNRAGGLVGVVSGMSAELMHIIQSSLIMGLVFAAVYIFLISIKINKK